MQISYENLIKMIKQLCLIPSPTGQEETKAQFIDKWLKEKGAKSFIDDANNVICQMGNEKKPKVVFMAHTDTVFPITTKLHFVEDDEFLKCPGVGDNVANVAGLMMAIEYLIKNKESFDNYNMVFVFTTGEEGLGNLAGCRHFMANNSGIKETISLDLDYDFILDNAVGSHRYEIKVMAAGGHSFHAFGNDNAIQIISNLVTDLYNIKVPEKEGTKTTYNVGNINGGTTVNSIAEAATILYEYRSDNFECLCDMKKAFENVIKKYKKHGYQVIVNMVGERPCAKKVNRAEQTYLLNKVENIYKTVLGREEIVKKSASLDFNIPLSMGIPSAGMGIHCGGGYHTEKEYIRKDSLKRGMQILINFILSYS